MRRSDLASLTAGARRRTISTVATIEPIYYSDLRGRWSGSIEGVDARPGSQVGDSAAVPPVASEVKDGQHAIWNTQASVALPNVADAWRTRCSQREAASRTVVKQLYVSSRPRCDLSVATVRAVREL